MRASEDADSNTDASPRASVSSIPDPHAPVVACYVCYFLLTTGIASAMTPTALTLTNDLSWDAAPERSARYYAFIFFASAIAKPACAWASDRGRGARRRGAHACAGCATAAASALGMSAARTRFAVYVWGGLGSVGAAHAYAALDGHVAERSGGGARRRAAAGQARAMSARTAGSCAGELASAVAMVMMRARGAMRVSAVWTVAAAVVAWVFVVEGEEAEARRARGGDAERRGATAREAAAAVVDVEYVKCAACVFLYRLAPTALDAFAVYTYSAFADVVPGWGYSAVEFFSNVGALAAPAAFGWAFTAATRRRRVSSSDANETMKRGGGDASSSSSSSSSTSTAARLCRDVRERLSAAPMWTVFVICAVVDAAFGLCRLFVVASPPSRDTAIASLSIANAFAVFGLRVGYMPIVVLAAVRAPRNLEAFGFAGLVLAADAGALVSAGLSSALLRAMSIGAPFTEADGSPTGRSWRPLAAFCVVVAACKALVPALVAPTLLANLSVTDDDGQDDEDAHDNEDAHDDDDDAPLLPTNTAHSL